MPDPWHLWREVAFITRLSDGGLVLTRNVPVTLRDDGELVLEQGLDSFDLMEVEQHHFQTLETLRRRGQRPEADNSLDHLLRALAAAGEATIRRGSQHLAKKFLALHVIIHGCISLPAGYFAGIGHWGLPLTNLILCIIMRIGETAEKRRTAFFMRKTMQQRQSFPAPANDWRGPGR
jgi:hypothetical protein